MLPSLTCCYSEVPLTISEGMSFSSRCHCHKLISNHLPSLVEHHMATTQTTSQGLTCTIWPPNLLYSIHCHLYICSSSYSHISLLYLCHIVTYALLSNCTVLYNCARLTPQLYLLISLTCGPHPRVIFSLCINWCNPNFLFICTLFPLWAHAHSILALALTLNLALLKFVAVVDLAKNVVYPPSLDNNRAKEEGEAQWGYPDVGLKGTYTEGGIPPLTFLRTISQCQVAELEVTHL